VRDSADVPEDLFDAMQVPDDELETWRIQTRRQLAGTPIDSSRQKEPDLTSPVSVRSRGVRYPYREFFKELRNGSNAKR
jgi:hypothetical protein